MFNYLQRKGLLFACLCLGALPLTAFGQACSGQEGDLPDTPVEVGGEGSTASNPEVTCFYFRFDSDITGLPTGITMDLWHEYEGDLGIFVEACGERLNVLQRPGTIQCDPLCADGGDAADCGLSNEIGSIGNPEIITFLETGTEPENGIAMGGTFGLTLDDACGVSTLALNSFTELWGNCPEGLIEAEICFADHADRHKGFVSNLNFIFPNPYICGCMDETALNYNENASVSSGDCIYECQDWIVEVPTTSYNLCQGADTLLLLATAPEADNPTFEWIGTGNGMDFLEDFEQAETAVFIPADFTGTIVYTVTATDQYLCPQRESVAITVSPAVAVEITGNTTVCGSDSTDLVLSGGPFSSVMWGTGAQTENIRVGPGTYEVTVSAPGLCPAVDVVTVTAFSIPDPLILGPDTICATDTAQLSIDTSFVSYNWSTGDTLSMIEVNQPGMYTLAVLDTNGCRGVDTFQLAHFDSLQFALPDTATFCSGENVSLQAPEDLFSYQWSNGDTTAQTTVTTPGVLSLIAVDSSGCGLTQVVQVEELAVPQPQIVGPPVLCPNETVELTTSEHFFAYAWSDGEQDSILTTTQAGTYTLNVTDELGCTGSASYELNAALPINIDLTAPASVCPGSQATIETTPGFADYDWNTGDSTHTIVVPGPGTYQLTVTSQEGCTQTAAVGIGVLAVTPPMITGDDALCPGEMGMLAATAGYNNYQWGDGTNGNTLLVDTAGTYILQATDSNNCTVEASFVVQRLDAPDVAITGSTQICEGGNGILEATPGLSTYSWSVAGASASSLNVVAPGNYSVTVTDTAGCTATASTTVGLSIPEPEIEGTFSYCEGDSAVLMVTDTFNTYQWGGGGTPALNILTVDTPGEYTLTVTDALGCSAATAVDITENARPEPVINGDQVFCLGTSTVLDAGAGYQSYEWSTPGNNNRFLTVSSASTFGVTVVDSNGCAGSTSTSTQVNPLPTPQIAGELVFCQGNETQLNATEEYASYSWSNGDTEQFTTINTTAPLTLMVVDSNSCTGTVTAQPEFFAVNMPQITGDTNLCVDGSTMLTASPGFASYQWSDGQTGPTATFDSVGTITLTVVDTNNCVVARQTLLNAYPTESLNVISETGFCEGETAQLTAEGNFFSFEWSNQDTTATITVTEPGTYSVTATDANGCTILSEGEVVAYPSPEPFIDGLTRFCAGFSTTLSTSNDYAAYLWSDNSTAPEISVAAAGTVSVTVTDANGCTGSTNAILETVDDLNPVVVGPTGFCPGEAVVLTVEEPYDTYNWSTGNSDPSIVVTTAGVYTISVTAEGGCGGETQVQIEAYATPEIAIEGVDRFCEGGFTTLSAVGNAGELLWSTLSSEAEISVDQPGAYTLFLRDQNGCTAEDEIIITALPLPMFEIQGDSAFCAGLNTTLQTTPTFASYNWSLGSSAASVTLSEGANVGVTVTDDNGCSASREILVNEIALPIADAGAPQNLDCDTETVTLGGDDANGESTVSYLWSGPGINANNESHPFPVVAVAGSYSLQVTDIEYNCVSTVSTVQVNDLSYVPTAMITSSGELNCATASVVLDGMGSETGPQYIYEWLDENEQLVSSTTDLLLTVNEAQTYTLLVRDTLTACTGMASTTVSIDTVYPTITFPATAELNCAVKEATITATTTPTDTDLVDLNWTVGEEGNILSATSLASIDIDAPGWYLLEVANTSNGCVTLDSVQITQDVTLPDVVTNGDQILFCNDEYVMLSGQGSSNNAFTSYSWLYNGTPIQNATSLQHTAVDPGMYTLVVTSEDNGCEASDTLVVSVDPNAPQVFDTDFNPPTCQGDGDARLWVSNIEGGMPPYLYSFNGQPFSTTTGFGNLSAGIYELTVEDANGCRLTRQIEIPDGNNVTLDLGPDQKIEEGETVSIFPQISIDSTSLDRLDWNVNLELPCPDCLIQEDLYLTESTRFFLNITDENGCPAEDNILITVEKDQGIYIPNAFSPNGDGRNDRFYIYTDINSVEEITLLRIFNRWGEFVWENTNFQPNDPTAGWDGIVHSMNPNPAVYVWYAEIKMRTGQILLLKGDVTLVK